MAALLAILESFGLSLLAPALDELSTILLLPVAADLEAIAAAWIAAQLHPPTGLQMMAAMIAGLAADANANGEDAATIDADQRRAVYYLLSNTGAPSDDATITSALSLAKIANLVAAGFPAPVP